MSNIHGDNSSKSHFQLIELFNLKRNEWNTQFLFVNTETEATCVTRQFNFSYCLGKYQNECWLNGNETMHLLQSDWMKTMQRRWKRKWKTSEFTIQNRDRVKWIEWIVWSTIIVAILWIYSLHSFCFSWMWNGRFDF